MNKSICKACPRFAEMKDNDDKWFCAKEIYSMHSHVIKGFGYYEKDYLHPISASFKEPPEWCEFSLEQIVADPVETLKLLEPPKIFKLP